MTWSRWRALRWKAVLVVACVSLTACVEKARTLHLAVTQFEVESIAAVDAIDRMRRAELAPPPQSPAEISAEFVRNVLEVEGDIDAKELQLLLSPYEVGGPSKESVDAQWAKLLGDLRAQYTGFARIFDRIEQANFIGRNIVPKAQPFVEKLTAQLAYFADVIARNPPQLQHHRSALLDRLNKIKTGNMPSREKEAELAIWRDEWTQLEAAEGELTRRTVEQCLKAAIIGREIRQQLAEYRNVALADIVEAVRIGFKIAQSITGADLSKLQGRADEIIQTVKSDPVWSEVAKTVLDEINAARATAVPVEAASATGGG